MSLLVRADYCLETHYYLKKHPSPKILAFHGNIGVVKQTKIIF